MLVPSARGIPDVTDDAQIGYRLLVTRIQDGRTTLVLDDLVSSVVCPAEE